MTAPVRAQGPYRGRFAPSPTGPLHFGSMVAALASWLHARAAGGDWLVRIEDIDPPREVAGAAELQLATLHAFGLAPDAPPMRQSQRSAAYRKALKCLASAGLLYECRCSRADLAPFGGIHPPACVASHDERAPALRVRVGEAAIVFEDAVQGTVRQVLAAEVGDFVVRRSDGLAAYQLAVVVDDAHQGVTDVVRGADLLDSTPRQLFLQQRLGLPTPHYLHVPLAVDAAGAKLGKSQGSLALDAARALRTLRVAWRFLGQPPLAAAAGADLPGWLHAAAAAFDVAAIPRTRALAAPGVHGRNDAGGDGACSNDACRNDAM